MEIKKSSTIGLMFALCFTIFSVDSALAKHKKHSNSNATQSQTKVSQAPSGQSRRHRGSRQNIAKKPKTRYAYPIDIFMLNAPDFDRTPLAFEEAQKVRYAFGSGLGSNFTPQDLIKANAFTYYPLHGGIFKRRETVKYIVMHSTETGIPMEAKRIINSWSSCGKRHPGAQFMVDRDGTIYETVDPELATVHVNIFKTLPGINNDNTIGIEMVHTGAQLYPPDQRAAVIRLVSYLQDRFKVSDENIITHRYAQQGDHTDPVSFDWDGFLSLKNNFRATAITMQRKQAAETERLQALNSEQPASVYLDIHRNITAPQPQPQAAASETVQKKESKAEPVGSNLLSTMH